MAAQDYTTLAVVKSAITKDSTDGRDALISSAITAASRWIDRRCGRYFYADASASTRTFRTTGRTARVDLDQVVLIDDVSVAAGVAVSVGTTGSYTVATGWELGPYEAAPWGRPFTEIRGASGWLSAYNLIQVTAKWGWPAVPDEIAQAAQLLAARLYRRKDSPQGVIGSADWGAMRVSRADPDVEALISPYVIHVIA